ncbi:MAG: hypothetical protein Q8K60_08130 [Parachlamydiaceae bacterium]|nr:hypothetical protein [Parachlamydiaceae bacterium]
MNNASNYGVTAQYLNYFVALNKQEVQEKRFEETTKENIANQGRVQGIRNQVINNLTLDTKVQKDKLHLEIKGRNIGNDITFYRNSFIKFFAKLFNTCQVLVINNKEFVVSKKSLKEHLESIHHNSNELESITDYNKYFNDHKDTIVDQIFSAYEINQFINDKIVLDHLNNFS